MTTASNFGKDLNLVAGTYIPNVAPFDANRNEEKPLWYNSPIWILDAGHGKNTAGKRSPIWEDGRQLFEWEFNRAIVKRLSDLMKKKEYQLPHLILVETDEDVPLKTRTDNANEFHKSIGQECVYLSIHANAGGGTGFEVFTSPGYTGKSDDYAEIIFEEYEKEFPELKERTDEKDGDHDKEENFWVLKETLMPAVLIECAFMDTLNPDCELLMSEEGRDRIAKAIFRAILRIGHTQN